MSNVKLKSLDVEHVALKFSNGSGEEEYPNSKASDRGSQFVSYFWKQLRRRIGKAPKLFSAYHSEIDGQTERANGLLKMYLRAFVNFHQDD
jgi:hypothetical protein